MSKQLNSILNKLPHATASKNASLAISEAENPRALSLKNVTNCRPSPLFIQTRVKEICG